LLAPKKIFLGTPGAYTPCHYDTYGFNLHAQIQGHKRWILFPPTAELCPTRLPYEESSVFSQLDVLGGPKINAKLKGIIPRAITLGPGDLLFVPPGWYAFFLKRTKKFLGYISIRS
jgi:HSPB1-associated protein 1